METKGKEIYFDSDEEFAGFCIAPYATVEYDENNHPQRIVCGYSEMYKKYVDQGMSFYIRDIDSKVYKHQIVSKRVPIKIEGMPHYNQSTPISLKVHNLEDYYGSEEYMSKFMSEE